MITNIVLHELHPWTRINDYEGEVVVTLHNQKLWAYLILPAANWGSFHVGDRLDAAYWLERKGEVQRRRQAAEPELHRINESQYRLVGRVVGFDDEERLIVESIIPMTVDLDDSTCVDPPLPVFAVGDTIEITGLLKLDPDPYRS